MKTVIEEEKLCNICPRRRPADQLPCVGINDLRGGSRRRHGQRNRVKQVGGLLSKAAEGSPRLYLYLHDAMGYLASTGTETLACLEVCRQQLSDIYPCNPSAVVSRAA